MSPEDGHSVDGGITVEELLGEELLVGSLVAGGSGARNVVTWCVPLDDDAGDLAGSAVVVADAALAASPDLVPALRARGAAALLVRRGATAADLTAAGALADDRGLPLLTLRQGVGFREVSRLIGTKVLTRAAHVLEYGTRIHRRLGDVFARGGGLPGLASSMAQLSGGTVVVLGTHGDVSASSGPRPADEIAAAAELVAKAQWATVERSDADEVITLELAGEPVLAILATVSVADHQYGSLLLLEPPDPSPHDLSQHRTLLHEGVSLTASELLRQQSIREAQERARNDFVHALLHGRFTDSLELAARAEHYAFPVESRFVVFIVSDTGLQADEDRDRRRARETSRAVRAVADRGLTSMTAIIGSLIVVVHELSDSGGDALAETAEMRALGERIHRRASTTLGVDVRVSYGRPHDRAQGVAAAYRDARTTEALARLVGATQVSSYSDLRVFAAISGAASSPAAQAFAEEILGPLRQADSQTGSLEELVLTYIQESGNNNATARRLHLHRNTMLYKLDRASRALQLDIRSTETQFMVWLAHHLDALRDVTGALDQELNPPR